MRIGPRTALAHRAVFCSCDLWTLSGVSCKSLEGPALAGAVAAAVRKSRHAEHRQRHAGIVSSQRRPSRTRWPGLCACNILTRTQPRNPVSFGYPCHRTMSKAGKGLSAFATWETSVIKWPDAHWCHNSAVLLLVAHRVGGKQR